MLLAINEGKARCSLAETKIPVTRSDSFHKSVKIGGRVFDLREISPFETDREPRQAAVRALIAPVLPALHRPSILASSPMPLKPLLLLGLVLTALSRLPAQSVLIEPPAPASYSENRPAFMCFKKIEISPRSSGSYDVEITLQGDLPSKFPKDRGAHFNMSFDFAEISPEKSLPTNWIPNFNVDLNISIIRGVNDSKFQTWPTTIEYRNRTWDIKVANLVARKDTISFSLRSTLFALRPPSQVVFRSNYMRATSPTQASGGVAHATDPVSPDLPGTKPSN